MSATTILVLSVDEAHLLERSLPLACAEPDAEVVVVDNACTDGTATLTEACGARVLRLPERRSYAAAVNAGLRAVLPAADAVLLLNADCFLRPGFLAAARPRLREPGVGAVAPRLLRCAGPPADPALPPQPGEVIDAAGMTIDRRRKNRLVGHGEPAARYAVAGEAFGPDGACALYRAEVLRALGPEIFDERMELWASDADVAWRIRRAGWRCVYEPSAVARHVRTYSPSTRSRTAPEHRRVQFRNRLLMVGRNETPRGLLRDGHRIAAYEAAALGFALLREPFLLRGYADAWRRRSRVRGPSARVPFGLEPPKGAS